jgi:RHS repeat-associated protein
VAYANYGYDAAGDRTSMQDITGMTSYAYDSLHRLTSATHPSGSNLPIQNEAFGYDAVGNRSSDTVVASYSYNAANELTSNSSFTYSYDNNGNQIVRNSIQYSTQTTYSYDSQNELTQVNAHGGGQSNYKYDALGRRIYKSTGTVASQTIQYIYDNQDIVAMVDGSNNLIALFTHGPGTDESMELHQSNGADFFLHADGLGSIIAYTDISGDLVEQIEYEAYGRPVFLDKRGSSPIVEHQSFTGSPYAYTGREWDSETNLGYLRLRGVDYNVGRYLQQDRLIQPPVLTDPSFQHKYAYVGDNPISRVDPSGLWYWDINLTRLGFANGGVLVNQDGLYGYVGFGVAVPGWAVLYSNQNPSVGWDYSALVAPEAISPAGPALSAGFDFANLNNSYEYGLGSPGGGFTFNKVLNPISWQAILNFLIKSSSYLPQPTNSCPTQ